MQHLSSKNVKNQIFSFGDFQASKFKVLIYKINDLYA